jgi:hypothetical protein
VIKSVSWLLLALTVSAPTAPSDRFVGEWKLNPSRSKTFDEMKVERVGPNEYDFDFGGGVERVVADGTDQPAGAGTSLAVSAERPDTWKVVRKQNGRLLLTAIWKLSNDGRSLTDDFTSVDSNGSTSNVVSIYNRSAGGSGFVGTWVRNQAIDSAFVLRVQSYEKGGLSLIYSAQGLTISVMFDGKEYPQQGPNVLPGSASSARQVNARTLDFTDTLDGKVRLRRRLELSSDAKTLTITARLVGRNEPNILVFERQ